MNKGICLLIVLLVLLTGCTTLPTVEQPVPEELPAQLSITEPKPNEIGLVDCGKTYIGNYYPGARAEAFIYISNGFLESKKLGLELMKAIDLESGYVDGYGWVNDWVLFDKEVVVEGNSIGSTMVVLEIPKGVEVSSKKWEFWILVTDLSQVGTMQTALGARFLVNMR